MKVTIQFDADTDSDAYHQALTACEIAANVAARNAGDGNAGQVDVHTDDEGWRATMLLEGPDKDPWVGSVPMTQDEMDTYLGLVRECDTCGRRTDAGEFPDWINGECEDCDPSILEYREDD